jgi:exonuclease III
LKQRLSLFAFIFLNSSLVFAQTLNDLSFGTDTTLELVSWNIEHFPKNGDITVNYVQQIIENIDADIYAFQEIDDTVSFKFMLADLPQYHYYFMTSWYAGLAFIYKHEVIQVNDLYEIYTSYPYWNPFPRAPKIMDFNFDNKNFFVINNHFKCCGDGYLESDNSDDEEARRYLASNLSKSYIDNYLPDKSVFLLGDLNDRITDPNPNNVFINFLNDSENYLFADTDIATGSSTNWSYPSWPSHLDHILITNELFDDTQNSSYEIKTLKIEQYLSNGWNEYEANVSDHRPVGIKILPNSELNSVESLNANFSFSNFPNPCSSSTTFSFNEIKETSSINLYDCAGQLVRVVKLNIGENSKTFHLNGCSPGVYYAKLVCNGIPQGTRKLVVVREG